MMSPSTECYEEGSYFFLEKQTKKLTIINLNKKEINDNKVGMEQHPDTSLSM